MYCQNLPKLTCHRILHVEYALEVERCILVTPCINQIKQIITLSRIAEDAD